MVGQSGSLSVEMLARHFDVSPQTIRRDVASLCQANLLRRRYGGVERMESAVNSSYDTRKLVHPEAKRRLAALVADLIPNGASVMFSIGTTPEMVALALTRHDDLTVVTNNLNVAMALSANTSNRIYVPGGVVRLPDRDLLGREVETLFASFRADFGIYGVGGIEPDGVLVDFDRDETQAREMIRQNCRQSILVADRSKFCRAAPARCGRLGDANLFVIDGPPAPELAALIESEGANVLYPEEVLP